MRLIILTLFRRPLADPANFHATFTREGWGVMPTPLSDDVINKLAADYRAIRNPDYYRLPPYLRNSGAGSFDPNKNDNLILWASEVGNELNRVLPGNVVFDRLFIQTDHRGVANFSSDLEVLSKTPPGKPLGDAIDPMQWLNLYPDHEIVHLDGVWIRAMLSPTGHPLWHYPGLKGEVMWLKNKQVNVPPYIPNPHDTVAWVGTYFDNGRYRAWHSSPLDYLYSEMLRNAPRLSIFAEYKYTPPPLSF